MEVVVNGRRRDVPERSTVAELVASLGFGSKNVVVEHNGEAVERVRFAETVLGPDDIVEVVRPVQGGSS
jgi:sulfur carrier protein